MRTVTITAEAWLDGHPTRLFAPGSSHLGLDVPDGYRGRLNLQIDAFWLDERQHPEFARVLTTWDVGAGMGITKAQTYLFPPPGALFRMSPGSSGHPPVSIDPIVGTYHEATAFLIMRHQRGHPLAQAFTVHLASPNESLSRCAVSTDAPTSPAVPIEDSRVISYRGRRSRLTHRAWAVVVCGEDAGRIVDLDLPPKLPYVARARLRRIDWIGELEVHVKSTWQLGPNRELATGTSHSAWSTPYSTRDQTAPEVIGPWRIERADSEGGGLVADIADTAIAPVAAAHFVTVTESLTPPSLDRAALSTSYTFEFEFDAVTQ